mmetsp:Transcript_27931/g.52151  ORF Transcript_27931/g.52151 Transcript_27931/m.52151 type:complete len:89 (-) Transcript_27931:245-511(-)
MPKDRVPTKTKNIKRPVHEYMNPIFFAKQVLQHANFNSHVNRITLNDLKTDEHTQSVIPHISKEQLSSLHDVYTRQDSEQNVSSSLSI